MNNTNQKVYGYWVGKSDIIEVGICEHESVGFETILKGKTPKKYSVYSIIMRLGYMRVVNNNAIGEKSHDIDSVEYWKSTKLSKLQLQFLNDSERYYIRHKNYLLEN